MATAKQVANYILWLSDDSDSGELISNLKLQKLLYYCQGFHLAMFDQPLFPNEIQAWQHGPVVKEIYQLFQGQGAIAAPNDADRKNAVDSLTDDQKEMIDNVYNLYGQFSAWRLREMTHQEAPWVESYQEGVLNKVIPNQLMKDYFKTQLTND
jgi:uncharacterized phage-associated protein